GGGNWWDNACSETLFGSLKVGATARAALRNPTSRDGRDHRLAALVQQHPTALDAGLRQSDAVRARLACRSAQTSQLMTSVMGYGFQGQGQRDGRLRHGELRSESGGIARNRSTATQRKASGFEDDRRAQALATQR